MKILLFTSAYKSNGSANGICARNLVREFVRQGHDVYVIAVPQAGEKGMEMIDGAKVWFEPHELYVRIFNYLQSHHSNPFMNFLFVIYNILRIIIFGFLYPNDCRFRVGRLNRRAVGLIEEYKIDTVIGTCLPYDGIPSAFFLKKKYGKKLRVVTYHFDLLSTPNNDSKLICAFKKWRFKKAFNDELNVVDKVYLPYTAKGLYSHPKIDYIGFPVYVKEEIKKDISFEFQGDCYNIVYIGSLDSRNRSPIGAIDYVENLNEVSEKKYILHIWGRLADTETINVVEEYKSCVQYHGMLDNSETYEIMMKADFLLNISNNLLYKLIPSKIFSMFSTGKPIINLVYHPNDGTLPYFELYGNYKRVNMYDKFKHNDFVLKTKDIIVDGGLFDDFTPQCVARSLLATS